MSREHILSPHRWILIAVVALLAAVAVGALNGPAWYQRLYHPLRYQQTIADNSRANGLDPYLVAAVINVESGFNSSRVSRAGAVGLMQVLPATAEEVARARGMHESVTATTLTRPGTSIRVGTAYLSILVRQYGGTEQALAAYNAGSANADRWVRTSRARGVPFLEAVDFPATRRYVQGVRSQRDEYASLYPEAFPEAPK